MENRLQAYRDKKGVIIAVHRGTNGGNIIQNTKKAYWNAIQHKGDMVEVDVVKSSDGEFYAFHDGQELLVFHKEMDIRELTSSQINELTCFNSVGDPVEQRLETIEEVLSYLQGKCWINIDRSWFYWDTFLPRLKTYPALDQVVLKAPADKALLKQLKEANLPVMFMPIVKTKEELQYVMSIEGLNIVAVELIFETLESELIQEEVIRQLHEKGILTWVNAIRLNDTTILSAQIDDESALFDSGESWGKLVELGFDIIQTDWPYLLYHYLSEHYDKK